MQCVRSVAPLAGSDGWLLRCSVLGLQPEFACSASADAPAANIVRRCDAGSRSGGRAAGLEGKGSGWPGRAAPARAGGIELRRRLRSRRPGNRLRRSWRGGSLAEGRVASDPVPRVSGRRSGLGSSDCGSRGVELRRRSGLGGVAGRDSGIAGNGVELPVPEQIAAIGAAPAHALRHRVRLSVKAIELRRGRV
jgi:hypothetical protein